MRLDGIVSAAGIWRRYSDRLTAEHSRETDFRVNTWAPVDIARMLISKLNPDATVLNISSVSAKFRDTPGFWNYSDSKSNLLQDTRALSLHREFQEK